MGTLALFNLLNQARVKNASLGVTGHLLYADGMFTQCIEGPASSIEIVWLSIQRDARHDQISVIERGPVKARRFNEWAMAFSSYRYLNSFNMPGFFPLNEAGVSEKSGLCVG
jgi:Sensors of blue-light using FAD